MGYPSGKGKAGMGDLALKFGIFTIAYNDYKDFIPSSCEKS